MHKNFNGRLKIAGFIFLIVTTLCLLAGFGVFSIVSGIFFSAIFLIMGDRRFHEWSSQRRKDYLEQQQRSKQIRRDAYDAEMGRQKAQIHAKQTQYERNQEVQDTFHNALFGRTSKRKR